MELAPLPDHNLINDRLWRRLFGAYAHVITPLRTLGLTTDMETCGSDYNITANLGDGSYLSIAADHGLPTDPADVTGWTVLRAHDDQPLHTVIYDSTEDGNDAEHGSAVAPMFGRIVHWMLAGPRSIHAAVPGRLGALLASLVPSPSTSTAPASSAVTGSVAEALKRHAARGGLPDLVRIVPEARGVVVTVQPKNLTAWSTWIALIGADDGHSTSRGDHTTATGRWSATPIRLIGLGVPRLNGIADRAMRAAHHGGAPA